MVKIVSSWVGVIEIDNWVISEFWKTSFCEVAGWNQKTVGWMVNEKLERRQQRK